MNNPIFITSNMSLVPVSMFGERTEFWKWWANIAWSISFRAELGRLSMISECSVMHMFYLQCLNTQDPLSPNHMIGGDLPPVEEVTWP